MSGSAGDEARVTLVLGGARSGKSRYAEDLADRAPHPIYLATAEAGDAEMAARIARHRARRGPRWITIEEPLDIAPAILVHARPGAVVLVECLTLWLANAMAADRNVDGESARLAEAVRRASGPSILVGNEVGLGIVPDTPLGRAYRDAAGRLNQDMARLADRVILVVAGLPMALKGKA